MLEVRRAAAADAPEVVRLRALMLASMGQDVEADPSWRKQCEQAFLEFLAQPRFVTFVVEAGPSSLAGCVTLWVDRRLPGPGHDGRSGYLANMSTDPAHRRRGVGRALLQASLAWLREEGVRRVDLHATSEGRALYERAGFAEAFGMRWEEGAGPTIGEVNPSPDAVR